MTLNDVLDRLHDVTGGNGQYYAKCPAHDDKTASLSISEGAAGRVLLNCHAGCSCESVVDALGLSVADLMGEDRRESVPPKSSTPKSSANTRKRSAANVEQRRIAAEYDYTDENGGLLFQKLRYEPKGFSIRRPDGRGGWIYDRKSIPLMPYNLPALVKSDYVFLVEGEKDVETLKKIELAATCSPDGAGSGKFKPELVKWFNGKSIYIIPDNDATGKAFSLEEAQRVAPTAKSVKILDLLQIYPELPEHGDITDVVEHMGKGQTASTLRELCNATPEYVPADGVPLTALCAADVKEKPVVWLWRNVFVRGGVNSIQGVAGMGKSFLLCAVSAAVSKGDSVQGVGGYMEALPQGKVLYISGDDDVATTLKPRLWALKANCDNIYFQPDGIFPVIGSVEFEQLVESVKPSLLILDTLQHFLPPRTELNSANNTTVALQPLKVLAEKHNCSVVVVQHISKVSASGNGGYSVNFGIGSSAINGIFRSVWTLGRKKDDEGKPSDIRALAPSKTNLVAGDPPSILFKLTLEGGFEWAGIDYDLTAEQLYSQPKRPAHRPATERDEAEEFISEVLRDGEMKSEKLTQFAVEHGISRNTLDRARKNLNVKSYKKGKCWYVSR
jgi:hypothetical protein